MVTAAALASGVGAALSVRLSHPGLHSDEITYMSGVLESMLRGSVFPLRPNGAWLYSKPPLALWLMRLSFELAGPSPLAARLPSVLAAVATAVVLYLFGAALFGEAVVGILAALIFAFTPGLLVLHGTRSATPDALEILLVTSAIAALELWRRRRRPWALAWLVGSAAASAWVKSPFALLVLMAYLLGTEPPSRRAGRGTPRFGATVALVAGVWIGAYLLWLGMVSAAISPRAVTRGLLLQQYVRRIDGRLGAAHAEGPGYYLASTIGDFGPLLLLPIAAAALAGMASWRNGRLSASHDVACLAVWALAAPVLATASVFKLPWYPYLSYPGIALLLAVSAHRLAQAVSGRSSVQAALLAAAVAVLAWRLPADLLWPAEARYRGLAGQFWEVARRDPRIAVIPGPGFRLPRQQNDVAREARLFMSSLLWRQSRGSPRPGVCRAILVNHRSGVPAQRAMLELYRPVGPGVGLWLVDDCDGRLRERLTGPWMVAPMDG